MAPRKNLQEKGIKEYDDGDRYGEPKRLSKAGEWLRANPNGVGGYVDWKAVMR